MSLSEAKVTVYGYSHPPDIKPHSRTPGGQVEWHKADCAVDQGAECPPPGCAAERDPSKQEQQS